MICETSEFLDKLVLEGYQNPKAKLTQMLKNGDVRRVRRGLLVKDQAPSDLVLALKIFGPSYVSFESALRHHDLISISVPETTSATMNKTRIKVFTTPFGTYRYFNIPSRAFRLGVVRLSEGEDSFWVATPEKALLDTVSRKLAKNFSQLEDLLFQELGIDELKLSKLDWVDIAAWSPLYRKRSVDALARWGLGRYGSVQLSPESTKTD